MSLLVLLLMVLYQLLLFGSQYNAFQDVFGVQGPDPNEDSDQLVA